VYVFSYDTNSKNEVIGVEVVDPDSTLRRVNIDDTGYWISRWGSYRRQ
jgi:hypothetical protein